MTVKVLINGAKGRMGQETVKAIKADPQLTLVGEVGHGDALKDAIQNSQASVVVDFTTASVAMENAMAIIEAGVHPVIGTSGFLAEDIAQLTALCDERQLGALIAPNFSIGAVLMMQFAAQAATYYPNMEIIELHHDKKQDAPSGTAVKTAQMLAQARQQQPHKNPETEIIPGARGANHEDIHIHSIRLPGLVAHQEVLFGGCSETLTIRHDSIHREAFMPGVVLACKKVSELDTLVYGLEHIL